MDKFIELCEDLSNNNKVRELIIFTSVEGTNKQPEYTRFGLNYETFWNNVDTFLTRLPKITINVMKNIYELSVFTYGELIDKILNEK